MNKKTTYKAVIIGGSAGSFQVTTKILSSLKSSFQLPVLLCLHRLKHIRKGFVETLSLKSAIPVIEPFDKDHIRPGTAYLSPANYHMMCNIGNTISLSAAQSVNHSRPSIDLTLFSASRLYREKVLCIILSGANKDGTEGAKAVKAYGGTVIIQSPESSEVKTMPESVLKITKVDYIYDCDSIISFLNSLD
jgi:two-component system chemotaxis response regulator CheB